MIGKIRRVKQLYNMKNHQLLQNSMTKLTQPRPRIYSERE